MYQHPNFLEFNSYLSDINPQIHKVISYDLFMICVYLGPYMYVYICVNESKLSQWPRGTASFKSSSSALKVVTGRWQHSRVRCCTWLNPPTAIKPQRDYSPSPDLIRQVIWPRDAFTELEMILLLSVLMTGIEKIVEIYLYMRLKISLEEFKPYFELFFYVDYIYELLVKVQY